MLSINATDTSYRFYNQYSLHRRHQILHDGLYIRGVFKKILTTYDLIIWEIDI